MMDEKPHRKMEDAASVLSSHSATLHEKVETGQSTGDATQSPVEEKHDLKVFSAKDAQEELTKIMTSGEGVEYPTGVKLQLISLALCLSVFLMALDNTIVCLSNDDC